MGPSGDPARRRFPPSHKGGPLASRPKSINVQLPGYEPAVEARARLPVTSLFDVERNFPSRPGPRAWGSNAPALGQ